MDIIKKIAEELGLRQDRAEAVVELMDEGNTVPFIARYRKERTGGMDDETLRAFDERLKYLRNLEDRKATVLASIEEQGKLTDELRKEIDDAETAARVEDLYRPYKPKRRTRATIAKERGLEPLADLIRDRRAKTDPAEAAEGFVDPEKGVPDADAAIAGALDIIAGDLSDDAEIREYIRKTTFEQGVLASEGKDQATKAPAGAGDAAAAKTAARSVYENYFDYREAVSKIPGHRVLAINRGEKEKALTVSIEAPEEKLTRYIARKAGAGRNELTDKYLKAAAEDAYKRLIAPSVENEIRGMLTESAEEGAMKIFKANLEQLLMQPPLAGKVVLGWDPAFRTGCKLAVCDATGKILETAVIYPTAPQNKVEEAKRVLKKLIQKHGVEIISVGNGTASRESEKIIADFIRETKLPVQYVIVNEAGASVYSASKLATEEYPDLDVGERSSASIARRLQDPLAELVKIDPKSIGVGQYQHDMDQKRLGEVLGGVVESCVNRVGVDLNTASVSLLKYISGISQQVASNIVAMREENGRFTSRTQLKKVPKLGPKAFEQCAGFLRITGGKEPLDGTAVHPESYSAARALLEMTKTDISDAPKSPQLAALLNDKRALAKTAETLGVGEYTLRDMIEELRKPGRDPRDEAEKPVLRSDVLSFEDLVPGMKLKGTVRNIVDFGAFVDIGVHQDGLVHISQLADRFVKHPLDVVKVGDIVDVTVLSVDEGRKKISLSMKKGI